MDLSVAVLVSSGRHPVSGRARASPGDVAALDIARRLGGNLDVFHCGSGDDPALQDYLAYGAARIAIVGGRGDPIEALADRLDPFDVVVTGSRAERGECSGLLPYMLANRLHRSIVGNVLDAKVESGEAIVRQFLPKGKRRRIAVGLPTVLAVHPLAPVATRYAHVSKVHGRIDWPCAGAEDRQRSARDGSAGDVWVRSAASRQLVKLKAQEMKAGHARMLSAVAGEAKSGIVAIEGTDVEKAQMLLAYLREHRLIDF